jgi:hypothetical protein
VEQVDALKEQFTANTIFSGLEFQADLSIRQQRMKELELHYL